MRCCDSGKRVSEAQGEQVKRDGSLTTWSDGGVGGDPQAVRMLTKDAHHVVGNRQALAAVKEGVSFVTWSKAQRGGNSSAVMSELQGGVDYMVGIGSAFAATKPYRCVMRGEESHGCNSDK